MSTPPPDKKRGRKLLVAAVGVATVSYVVACGSQTETSGNLMPPDTGKVDGGGETGFDVSSGNLVAPDTGTPDTSAPDAGDAATDTGGFDVSSGNLVPPDTGSDGG